MEVLAVVSTGVYLTIGVRPDKHRVTTIGGADVVEVVECIVDVPGCMTEVFHNIYFSPLGALPAPFLMVEPECRKRTDMIRYFYASFEITVFLIENIVRRQCTG